VRFVPAVVAFRVHVRQDVVGFVAFVFPFLFRVLSSGLMIEGLFCEIARAAVEQKGAHRVRIDC
jgi:hypothetical protein